MSDTPDIPPADEPAKDFYIHWKDGYAQTSVYSDVKGSTIDDQGFMILFMDDMAVVVNRSETKTIEVVDHEFS